MEHITGDQWWTRYQPVSYVLESRSGNRDEFASMVERCEAVGVSIVADSVVNHMAAGSSGTGTAGTSYSNRQFPDYDQSDFHHTSSLDVNCQVTDYTDQHSVQECDLVGLPDLDTSSTKVQDRIAEYLNDLYSLGVKGFRVDAAKHQEASQMNGYIKQLPSDALVFGEVIEGGNEAVKPEMYEPYMMVTEFDWALDVAPNVISSGKMQYLDTIGESWGLITESKAVIFTDNHDTERGGAPLTYKDGDSYNLLNMVMVSSIYGYPKVMSSYYFSDHDQGPPSTAANEQSCGDGNNWVCQHRWSGIANLVNWRKSAVKGENGKPALDNWTASSDGNVIAYSRGGAAWIALNRGGDASGSYKTGLPAGEYCNVIQSDDVSSCETVTVASDGSVNVNVPGMGAVAIHTMFVKSASSATAIA
jgi:alpha-amylase